MRRGNLRETRRGFRFEKEKIEQKGPDDTCMVDLIQILSEWLKKEKQQAF